MTAPAESPTSAAARQRGGLRFPVLALGAMALAIILAGFSLIPMRSSDAQTLARSADDAFARGIDAQRTPSERREAFREAASRYEELRRIADLPETNFNLGNARFRAGDVAGAIAAYRRALVLAPLDDAIEANLQEARRAVESAPPPPKDTVLERIRRAAAVVPAAWRAILLAILWSAGFLALARRAHSSVGPEHEHRNSEFSTRAAAAWAAIAVAVLLGIGTALDRIAPDRTDLAVLVSQEIARKGNGTGFEQAFANPLPAGTECRIREVRPGWARVELGDASSAWLPDASLLRVAPPSGV